MHREQQKVAERPSKAQRQNAPWFNSEWNRSFMVEVLHAPIVLDEDLNTSIVAMRMTIDVNVVVRELLRKGPEVVARRVGLHKDSHLTGFGDLVY